MKLFIIVLIPLYLFSQKYDNTWIFGACNGCDNMRPFGNTDITFYQNKVDTHYKNRYVEFDRASMSISDPITGDLQLFSNGCSVFDADNNKIKLTDTLNPGQVFNDWCQVGYPLSKAGFFLPDLSDPNSYYLLHLNEIYKDPIGYFSNYLYATKLKKKGNSWEVESLRDVLHDGPMFTHSIEVVKHANNKDYWILYSNYNSDTLYRLLFTEKGFISRDFQLVNIPRGQWDWGSSTTATSDGTKYIRIDLRSGLTIFDFDRLTGLVNNMRFYKIWIPESEVNNLQIMELSVSPDSRMLYVSTPFSLWQFDLYSNDIEKSRILIDTFDWFQAPFGTTFFRHQLAPDGKIYLNCTNGDNYMHIIHKPNLRGKDCMFKQHDLLLPTYNAFTLPYFPNYRLGVTNDSNDSEIDKVKIYPNPVRSYLRIEKPIYYKVRFLDCTGKIIFETYKNEIRVEDWPQGLYYAQILNGIDKARSIKIVKL